MVMTSPKRSNTREDVPKNAHMLDSISFHDQKEIFLTQLSREKKEEFFFYPILSVYNNTLTGLRHTRESSVWEEHGVES